MKGTICQSSTVCSCTNDPFYWNPLRHCEASHNRQDTLLKTNDHKLSMTLCKRF